MFYLNLQTSIPLLYQIKLIIFSFFMAGALYTWVLSFFILLQPCVNYVLRAATIQKTLKSQVLFCQIVIHDFILMTHLFLLTTACVVHRIRCCLFECQLFWTQLFANSELTSVIWGSILVSWAIQLAIALFSCYSNEVDFTTTTQWLLFLNWPVY